MGRKKKKPTKPWCWYCNREFDDEKILIQHQKAKHYKCHVCHKKLYTGPGLAIHCMQVHKEMIDKIPNALPNRNSVDIEIYGMQGIPEDDIREHEKNRGNDGSSYIPPPSVPKPPLLGTTGLLPSTISSGLPPSIPFPGMPLLPPGLPPGLPPLPPGIPPPHGHFPPASISINLPRKPLFPSASAMVAGSSTQPSSTAASTVLSAPASISKPSSSSSLLPGPSGTSVPSSSTSASSISTGNPMSRIVHPGEDISLEELRARKAKYQMARLEGFINQQAMGPIPGQLPPPIGLNSHSMPPGLPTGPPPAFHIPPPGFNGHLMPPGLPPTLPPPLPGRRWDAPPPAQPTFQSTFKPAY